MILIDKGNTGNTFVTTVYEKLSQYNLTGATGTEYFYKFVNDLDGTTYNLSVIDTSINPWRYNEFTIDETLYNFKTGYHSYSAATTSGYTQILETGRMVVSGSSTNSSVYW